MSSILNSQGMALAAAMATVSVAVILLSFCAHNPISVDDRFDQPFPSPAPGPCIASDTTIRRRKKKNKKRVHFAEDLVSYSQFPTRNPPLKDKREADNRRIPENRVALYGEIMKSRAANRLNYSY